MNEPLQRAVNETIENIKKAREALKQNDLNGVSWYLDLAEKHAWAVKEEAEKDDQ